jgi:SAM-dependent methyltransferase
MNGQQAAPGGDDPARWRDQPYPGDYQSQVQRAIAFSGVEHDFFVAGKVRWLAHFMQRNGIKAGTVNMLDIGCGIGLLHRYLPAFTDHVVGVDVSEDALRQARQRNSDVAYQHYDGRRLPFGAGQFDLALAVTVMHHVPVAQWPDFVREAHRVIKPGGAFIVIEHNPLNPLTRYVVSRSEIDADAVLLRAGQVGTLMRQAGFQNIGRDYIFFTPFKARLIQVLEQHLAWLPLGAQYAAYGFKGD